MEIIVGVILGWILGAIMGLEHYEKKVKSGMAPYETSQGNVEWKEEPNNKFEPTRE